MIQRYLCLGVLAASVAGPIAAMAHGPMEGTAAPATPAAATAAPVRDAIPANLLAAVCGMHGHHDAANFQRRVDLARVLLARADAGAKAPEAPPLFADLGVYSYPVTTASPQAQRYFDQGLRLAYGFNHAEARRAFRKAQQIDPDCALCHWGEAMVLGPNINAPMEAEAAAPALAAVTRAMALAPAARPHERALIEALARRYAADPAADRRSLDAAYAEAMMDVAKRYPDDADITVLTAEALMDLSPWDYWQAGGAEPKGHTAEIVRMLEAVMERKPDHIGAIHYYIHMVEASDRPERAVPGADRLASFDLGAGHLVHMPSHIYYRVGRYLDSLQANRRAVATDEAYLESIGTAGIYPGAYFPHNIHFLMASAQMAGDGPTAVVRRRSFQAYGHGRCGAHGPLGSADHGRTLFRPRPVQPAGRHHGGAGAVGRVPLRQGDVALRPRRRAGQGRGRGGGRQAEADAIAALERTADFSGLESAGVPPQPC